MACISENVSESPEFKKLVSKIGLSETVRDYLQHGRVRDLSEVMSSKSELFKSKEFVNDVPNLISSEKNFNEDIKKGFFSDFNIDIQEYDSIKKTLGYDSGQMVDMISKFVALNKGEKLDKSVAYFAYMLLGRENNKIRSELRYRIKSWDKYNELFQKYKEELHSDRGYISDRNKWKNLIRDKIIVDYLAATIVEYYNNPTEFEKINQTKWTKDDFSFIKKLYNAIKKILEQLGFYKGESVQKLNNTAKNIAHDILNREYQIYNYKLNENQILKRYNETISSDTFAKNFVSFAQSVGLVLSGSLALRRAGSVYRPADETVHDLDLVVPYELNVNPDNAKVYRNILRHQGPDLAYAASMGLSYVEGFSWYKELKAKYPSLTLINGFYGGEHVNFQSFTVASVIDGEFYETNGTHEENGKTVSHLKGDHIEGTGYVIDFFIRLQPHQEQHENYFKLWKEIMIAKIVMGRVKDFTDYKAFVPYIKSKDTFNFYYPEFVYSARPDEQVTLSPESYIIDVYQGYNGVLDNREFNYFTLDEKEAQNYGTTVRKVSLDTTGFLKAFSNYDLYRDEEKKFTEFTGKVFDVLDNSPQGLEIQNEFFRFLKAKGYGGLDLTGWSDSQYVVSFYQVESAEADVIEPVSLDEIYKNDPDLTTDDFRC